MKLQEIADESEALGFLLIEAGLGFIALIVAAWIGAS